MAEEQDKMIVERSKKNKKNLVNIYNAKNFKTLPQKINPKPQNKNITPLRS